MSNLMQASHELFTRRPDERFASLSDLFRHCLEEKNQSVEQWHPPSLISPQPENGGLAVVLDQEGTFGLNDWSFTQLCRQANVAKDTVNRVSAITACHVFGDTLPHGVKPIQVFTMDSLVRSIHGTVYTRLYNADLLSMAQEFATDFQPPQQGMNGGTGLYCGEQDMFCFLIDPTGWIEVEDQAFAPGFFLWNSEVGRRTVGIQTFWFQQVCANHIVWDTIDVSEFTRRHTGKMDEALGEIRRLIEGLNAKRDERRDGFARLIKKAMESRFGTDADAALKVLIQEGLSRNLAKEALDIARQDGAFTLFSLMDALTRLSQRYSNAGDRTEADARASRLLAMV